MIERGDRKTKHVRVTDNPLLSETRITSNDLPIYSLKITIKYGNK